MKPLKQLIYSRDVYFDTTNLQPYRNKIRANKQH